MYSISVVNCTIEASICQLFYLACLYNGIKIVQLVRKKLLQPVLHLSYRLLAFKYEDGFTYCKGTTTLKWPRVCIAVQIFLFSGNVENVQIHPRFQNFDIKSSKQSLPVIGTFETSLHNFATQEEQSVPVRIFDKNVRRMFIGFIVMASCQPL